MLKSQIRYDDKSSVGYFAMALKRVIGKDPVFFCIGSDKCVFDSLGPKVGTRLKERAKGSVIVYGVEGDTIMAKNLRKAYRAVRSVHPTSTIVAIDAAVGDDVGFIRIIDRGIRPGAGAGKDLGIVGNESILCITTKRPMYFVDDYDEIERLVNCAADTIANAILLAVA